MPCTDLRCCTNCKNINSPKQVDVNEIFNDDDDFGEYQDGDTDGETDDEVESDWSKTVSTTKVDYATVIDFPYRTSSVFHT